MRIAFLWNASHLPVVMQALGPGDVVFPLSQCAFAAAKHSNSPLPPIPFWEVLRGLDIETIDRAAADALLGAVRNSDKLVDLNRPKVWHDAREAAYVGMAAKKVVEILRPTEVVAIGGDAESDSVAAISQMMGISTRLIPPPGQVAGSIPPDPPEELLALPNVNLPVSPWTLMVGTAIADWGMLLASPRLAKKNLLILLDPLTSGNLPALYEICSRRNGVRLLPLWRVTSRSYSERGDNSVFAEEVGHLLDRLVNARPQSAVISDLRRVETATALRKLKHAGIPVVVVAHSGATMQDPYRFSTEELANTEIRSWTSSAAKDYGSTHVETPRRIRTDPPRRLARAAIRTLTSVGPLKIGVVVTTAASYAAPEHDLAELLDSFRLLVATSSNTTQFVVRLREREDDPEVWRSVVDGASNVSFESSAARPMVAFVRSCSLLVEVGSESTAFLEAAGNFTPYVRIGAPARKAARFGRTAKLVPRLDPANPNDLFAIYARSRRARARLALRQHDWLMKETKS